MRFRTLSILLILTCALLLLSGWDVNLPLSGDSLRLTARVIEGDDSRSGPTRVVLELVNTTGQEMRISGRSFLELLGREEYDICRASVDLRADNSQNTGDYDITLEPAGFVRVEYVLQDLLWTSTLLNPRQPAPFVRAVPAGKYKLRLALEVSAVNGPAFPFNVYSNKVRLDLR